MNIFKLLLSSMILALGVTAIPAKAIELSDVVNDLGRSNRDNNWDDNDNDAYSWRTFRGSIPSGAVAGGRDAGRTLYVCQARYMDGVHPGELIDGRCKITWGGVEVAQKHFRVLVGDGLRWRFVRGDRIPSAAIPGGGERGGPLYICQARYAGGIHPGKVFDGACHIAYNGKDVARYDFRVLVPGRGNDDWSSFDDRYGDDDGIGSRPGAGMGATPPAGLGATPPAK